MEESKRAAEQDVGLTKYREHLLTTHSLEIEKINDRHRNEMKKYHVSSWCKDHKNNVCDRLWDSC